MSNVKLSYFDFDGGRGEPARLALAIGGINFDDHRIPISDWPAYRDKTPFFAVPMITVDGTVFTQSSSINRYLGKRVGLYPTDDLQSLLCDEAMDAADDITTRIVQTMNLPDADKRRAREELQTGRLTRYLEQFQAKLIAAGGEYFADQRLTVAGLKVFVLTRWLRTGVLDHIPKDFVDRVAPLLVRHLERVASHPGIAAYYQRRNAA